MKGIRVYLDACLGHAEKDKRCNSQHYAFFGWIGSRQISIFAKPNVPQYQSGFICLHRIGMISRREVVGSR